MEPRGLFLLVLLGESCDAEATCEPEPRNVTAPRTAWAGSVSPCCQIPQLTGKEDTFPQKANLPQACKCASWKLKSGGREAAYAGFHFLTSAKRGLHEANIWFVSNSPDGTLEIHITYLVIFLSWAKENSLKARLWLAQWTATNKISKDVCLSTRKSPRHRVLQQVLEKQPAKSP